MARYEYKYGKYPTFSIRYGDGDEDVHIPPIFVLILAKILIPPIAYPRLNY